MLEMCNTNFKEKEKKLQQGCSWVGLEHTTDCRVCIRRLQRETEKAEGLSPKFEILERFVCLLGWVWYLNNVVEVVGGGHRRAVCFRQRATAVERTAAVGKPPRS